MQPNKNWTRTTIQDELDKVKLANLLESYIDNFTNEYECDDIVFGINENGKPCEIMKGYMAITERYDTLHEAIKTVTDRNCLVRYNCDGGFYTGTYHKCLTECSHDVVFDIENLEYIF